MHNYHFLPYTITLHQKKQDIPVLPHTFHIVYVLQGHAQIQTTSSQLLNELDMVSLSATSPDPALSCPDTIAIRPASQSIYALFQISMDYICCRNHFVTPSLTLDSTSESSHSCLAISKSLSSLITLYFTENTPKAHLEKALEDMVYLLLSRMPNPLPPP